MKASILNLGCKVNGYEADKIAESLRNSGFEIVDFNSAADVCIINTCTVTNTADGKSRQMIHRAKKANPESLIVACGCYVDVSENDLKKDNYADVFVKNSEKADIVKIINDALENKKNALTKTMGESLSASLSSERINRKSTGNPDCNICEKNRKRDKTRAFLKIQDGCNMFCSYCIIPYARGRIASKDEKEILKEAEMLAKTGVKEVVITGIHLASFGMDKTGRCELIFILQKINEIQGIDRIRIGSLEPLIVTNSFAKELCKVEKLCPHFHLSLQSGCDKTLLRMNRKYTTKMYEHSCDSLRNSFSHVAITTDIIVGFPGETDSDFYETARFTEKIGFFQMHVFQYSRRKNTPAAGMPEQIPNNIKASRSRILIELSEKMSYDYIKSRIGKNAVMLTEKLTNTDNGTVRVGYTEDYIKVFSDENVMSNQVIKGTLKNTIIKENKHLLVRFAPTIR